MAELWSLKVQIRKNITQRKKVVYCKFEEIKAKVGKYYFYF